MARIVVHIGAHKTATSYLQKRFSMNRDALAAHGVLYPECRVKLSHACLSATWVTPLVDPAHYEPEGRAGHLDAFVARHAKVPGTVVISAEVFSRARPTMVDMTELAARLAPFEDAQVIFAVRDQPAFIQSLWMQRTKNAESAAQLGRYVAQTVETGYAAGLEADFNLLYDRVAEGFGSDRITVFNYADMCRSADGPFGTMLQALGVTVPADTFVDLPSPLLRNKSPDPLAFELARCVTQPLPPPRALVHAARRALEISDDRPTSLLSRTQRQQIADRFAPVNAQLVEKVQRFQPQFSFDMPQPAPGMMYSDDLSEAEQQAILRRLRARALRGRLIERAAALIPGTLAARRRRIARQRRKV